ncbi:MAG: hypothetical protein GDA42_03275 [Ekhidna sp.]|nr:hypothetical protein [Ekhidna sp.]MBC6409469.1 hypothetical protein [Ekhidna sp.]
MLRQSRKDCYDTTVVILNLQGFQNLEGFSNIIHQQEIPFSSKHVCVRQRKLRESGEPFAKCPVLKQNGNPKE